jgi:hypothetical protein
VSRYLLVANETAESQEMLHVVSEINADDPDAEFEILIPATPLNLLQQFEGTAKSARGLAARRAQSTRLHLESLGIRVRSTRVGNWDPYADIEEEFENEKYEAIVLSTLPPGSPAGSGWIYHPASPVAILKSGSSMWFPDRRPAGQPRSRRTSGWRNVDPRALHRKEAGDRQVGLTTQPLACQVRA